MHSSIRQTPTVKCVTQEEARDSVSRCNPNLEKLGNMFDKYNNFIIKMCQMKQLLVDLLSAFCCSNKNDVVKEPKRAACVELS